MVFIDYMDSPLGPLEIKASDSGVARIGKIHARTEISSNYVTKACKSQLNEYFKHERNCFDLPIDQSGTSFQEAVWRYLQTIPYGTVVSYKEVAKALGNPNSMRAVGYANAKNSIGIVIPCHRVVASNGKLTGYTGGLDRKAKLLEHEGVSCYRNTVESNCKISPISSKILPYKLRALL